MTHDEDEDDLLSLSWVSERPMRVELEHLWYTCGAFGDKTPTLS